MKELANDWGFNAVILANGAWKDRPLPIDGIDEYIGKGLYYQNPFIHWYNHKHEKNYSGTQYKIPERSIVIGGGLASLDVLKVIMFENVQKALAKKGHDVDLFKLDKSIAKVLQDLNLSLEDLGVVPPMLYYRRRIKDMPLTPMATDTPEKLLKAQPVREKVFNNYQTKYLFNFKTQHVPVDKIVENGRLAGLIFKETEVIDGRVKILEGTEKEVRASVVISSIGSIPSPISGIPMDGSVYEVDQNNCCRLLNYENVFAIGNAVTGRGNIIESMKHGKKISEEIIEKYGFDKERMIEEGISVAEQNIQQQVENIKLEAAKKLSESDINQIDERIQQLQSRSGYTQDFLSWVDQHLPERLEDQLGIKH